MQQGVRKVITSKQTIEHPAGYSKVVKGLKGETPTPVGCIEFDEWYWKKDYPYLYEYLTFSNYALDVQPEFFKVLSKKS